MNDTIKIFGYGTLINEVSLKKTIPEATNISIAKLQGYIRVFNILETRKLTRKNGGKIAVLNIEKSNINDCINGICFDMPIKKIEKLQKRENNMNLLKFKFEIGIISIINLKLLFGLQNNLLIQIIHSIVKDKKNILIFVWKVVKILTIIS